ncbi:MAG: 4Fe-4S binding protein [Planctomycetota bacterium]
MKKKTVIEINENYCKGCEICINFCPKKVFSQSNRISARGYSVPEVTKPEKCTGCLICEHLCPDIAITVLQAKDNI